MRLSVIIPARNEKEVINEMVTMLIKVFDKYISQLIVVNDGSSDQTSQIVNHLRKTDKRINLINRKSPYGVGLAIREGLKYVNKSSTHVLTLDADFTRNIPDLFAFFNKIDECDGIIGSRYMEKYSLVRYPGLKKFFNRCFHMLVKYFYEVDHQDLTNNFKLYKKSVFDTLPLSATDYAINAETGLYPILLGFNIKELPVIWFARGKNMGQSKFKLLSVAPGYLRVLFRAQKISKKPIKYEYILTFFQKLAAQMGLKTD